MSDLTLSLTQRPDHVARVGDTIVYEGTPYVIRDLKPVRESGCFLDWEQRIESNVVVVSVERFDGNPA